MLEAEVALEEVVETSDADGIVAIEIDDDVVTQFYLCFTKLVQMWV